jgi:hypothetical protein
MLIPSSKKWCGTQPFLLDRIKRIVPERRR